MWSIYIALGIVTLAGIISVIYMWWYKSRRGFTRLAVESEKLTIIGECVIRAESGYQAFTEEAGQVLVYSSASLLSPMELDAKALEVMHRDYPDHAIIPLPIPLEPGYNAFRIADKQLTWLSNAMVAWRSSVFHALMLPLELFLRWSFLPTWMMIDFVDHVGRYYAAVIIPKASIERLEASGGSCSARSSAAPAPSRNALRFSSPSIRFIESYSGLYASPKISRPGESSTAQVGES